GRVGAGRQAYLGPDVGQGQVEVEDAFGLQLDRQQADEGLGLGGDIEGRPAVDGGGSRVGRETTVRPDHRRSAAPDHDHRKGGRRPRLFRGRPRQAEHRVGGAPEVGVAGRLDLGCARGGRNPDLRRDGGGEHKGGGQGGEKVRAHELSGVGAPDGTAGACAYWTDATWAARAIRRPGGRPKTSRQARMKWLWSAKPASAAARAAGTPWARRHRARSSMARRRKTDGVSPKGARKARPR